MRLHRVVPGLFTLYILCLGACDPGSTAGAGGDPNTIVPPRGCVVTTGSAPPVAPGGYYTNGTTVCTADGVPHLFHGVARPSLEWDSQGEGSTGEGIPASDFKTMAADWHANVVRIAMNQDFWLQGAALHDPSYPATIDRAVQDAKAAGMDVILDLHWSDQGNLGVTDSGGMQDKPTISNQQPMADVNSETFWREVATKYKDDGHVLFELYNEPHNVSWDVWLNGRVGGAYTVVGMQQLYNTVRATGANNVVIAGGLSYAFDLSGVANNPIAGYNVIYASHPYYPQDPQARWVGAFGYLANQDIAPVILTEFGDGTQACTGDWDSKLIQFMDQRQISWTAWAWWAGTCSFPALLSDWDYTPSVQGAVVKAALRAYP